MDEIKIEPITFYGPGVCPECLTPLIIAERDLTVMDLDKDGNVFNIVESEYYCNAMCPKCKNKIKMMRTNGSYKPYSEVRAAFDDIDFAERLRNRHEGKYSIEGNPISF